VVKAGDEIDVKILRVDRADRKIGLSLKRAQWAQEEEKREEVRAERTKTKGLKGGLEGGESTTGLGDLKLGQ
jgi:small subunit ribosomal protein S1